MNLLYKDGEGKPVDTRGISWPPPPEGRNLLAPYIPGTRENAAIERFPNPMTTPPSRNPIMQGFIAAPLQAVGNSGKALQNINMRPKIGDEIRFIRYGRPTKNSTDWSNNETLPGMSVYSLNPDGSAQQTIRAEFADRPQVYIGKGKVSGYGSDGEPLVSDYTVRKATKRQDEKAYYGGKSRAKWLKEHGYDPEGLLYGSKEPK